MGDTTTNAPQAEGYAILPVWGRKADGKPFHGINLRKGDQADAPTRQNTGIVSTLMLEFLASLADRPEQLKELPETARKALLWRMTHRAVANGTNGDVTVVERKAGASDRVAPRQGEAF